MAELDARRAEVLSNAAKTIQHKIRTHNARKQFIALRKATIHVQSLWRGEKDPPSYLFLVPFSKYFILILLLFFKLWLFKVHLPKFVMDICVGRLACKLYESMKREAGAVKIQKNIRRYQARKGYSKLRVSGLVLQTGLRAMAARKEFRFRKRTKAAMIMQVAI